MDPIAFVLFSCILAFVLYAMSRWSPAGHKQGKPSPPQNLTVTNISESAMTLAWQKPEHDGGSPITEYIIQKRKASQNNYESLGYVKGLKFLVKDLRAGTTYMFKVAAKNGVGMSEFAYHDSPATTIGNPSPPKNLTVVDKSDKNIRLVWEEPDDDGGSPISGYIIQKWEASLNQYVLEKPVEEPECLVENLRAGATYMFKVAAKNRLGTSEYVHLDSPATMKGKPSPPQNLTVTNISEAAITLAWQKPEHDGGSPITEYIIQKRKASQNNYESLGYVKGLNCLVEDLRAGTAYMFKVAAKNGVGMSEFAYHDSPATTIGLALTLDGKVKKYKALTMEEIKTIEENGSDFESANEKRKKAKDTALEKWTLSDDGDDGDTQAKGRTNKRINLVLIGKTGGGKSSTGNLLLGKSQFDESAASESCTSMVQKGEFDHNGFHISIMDTPGFQDTSRSEKDILTELSKIFEEFSEGIDGVLFVLSMGNPRFTDDQIAAFKTMEEDAFGDGVIHNCFVILTHIDSRAQMTSLSEYLNGERESQFGKLLNERVKRRVIAVNNAEKTIYGREVQRENIIKLVLAKTDKPFFSKNMQKYLDDQKKLSTKLPASVRNYAPQLRKEVAAALRPMNHQTIKRMRKERSEEYCALLNDVKLRMIEGTELKASKDLEKAVETTFDDVSHRLVGTSFLKDLSFAVLLVVAGGTGVILTSSVMAAAAGGLIVGQGIYKGIKAGVNALFSKRNDDQ